MRKRRLHLFSGFMALLIGVGVHVVAQQKNAVTSFTDGDWPRYASDFAGTKHSKLTQINTANVSRLVQAWTFQGVGAQQTPIAVNGIVYASAPGGVVALDGASGELVWRYGAATAGGGGRGGGRGGRGGRGAVPTAEGPGGAPSSRGVAYWPGDGTLPPRLLMMVGQRLVALNAASGTLDTSFGTGGFVDIGVNWGGVPLVFKNIVIVGSNNGEVTQGNSPGDTKAYDARTGAKLWTFVSKLNATGAATPMTYQGRNGKQYVVQASAGTLNAFTLP